MVSDPLVIKAVALIKPLLRPSDSLFLFGSRTTNVHHPYSDIDFGIESSTSVPFSLLSKMFETLEESDLPVKVDIVDFSKVTDSFKSIAKQQIQTL